MGVHACGSNGSRLKPVVSEWLHAAISNPSLKQRAGYFTHHSVYVEAVSGVDSGAEPEAESLGVVFNNFFSFSSLCVLVISDSS